MVVDSGHYIYMWKKPDASVDIIFLGLIICTVTLTAMCYLYIVFSVSKMIM